MTTLTREPVAGVPDARPVIQTIHGAVRGSVADGVSQFMGVPYAAPPFGPNRFRPPQPVQRWSGIRDALTAGPMPPQLPYPPPWDVLIPERGHRRRGLPEPQHLDARARTAGLPVMVWIPGGMFEAGSGATYDGSRFARDGVVCVTINYRVGAEGFLYLPDGDANLGLLDQIAALEWVRDNIAAFGGDPDNVTIFGQSAGAMSVGTLLSMPRAEGLFRRAIAQSGGAHQAMLRRDARKVAGQLAERLGVAPTREAIAAVPVDRMLRAQGELKADLMAHPDPERWGTEVVLDMLPWQPVIDGDVVPARRSIASLQEPARTSTSWPALPPRSGTSSWCPRRDRSDPAGGPDQRRCGVWPAGGRHAGRLRRGSSDASPGEPSGRYPGRSAAPHPRAPSGRGTREGQRGHLHVRVRLALTAVRRPSRRVPWSEVAFVFDQLGQPAESLAGPNPPQQLAGTMHTAWIGFARDW